MLMLLARSTNQHAERPVLGEQIQNFGTRAQERGAARAALSCNCGIPVAVRGKAALRWDPRFCGQTERFFIPDPAIVLPVTRPSTTLRKAPGPQVPISRATMPRMTRLLPSKRMAT